MPLCRYYRRKCGAAALSLCSYAPEKHSACVRQIRKALFFSTSLLNRVPVFKCVHLNSSSSSASHINTDTHTHGQRTHTHCSSRLYRRILFCHASLSSFQLTALQKRTERQSLNINLHKLFNSNMRAAKSRGCAGILASPPSMSFPSLTLPQPPPPSALQASSFSPVLPESQILTEVKILSRCMRLVSSRKFFSPYKASLFLQRYRASPRAFLDADAFE